MPRTARGRLVALSAFGVFVALVACATGTGSTASARAGGSFAQVAKVLRHPRCLNCHTVTEFPRVGDDRRRHAMNVLRGPSGNGEVAMRCSACHRSENQPLVGVPGAPHWHLSPLSMGWEGLDDHDLAEAVKDRARNGNRSFEDLLHHVAEDPLVLWGWDPGPGREPVPMAHDAFVAAFEAWISGGAVTPPSGTTSTF